MAPSQGGHGTLQVVIRRDAGVVTVVVAVVAAVLGLRAFRALPGPGTGAQGLRVVTTTPVLYSLTAKVLGDQGALTNLVPPGASPETYALRPRDAEELARTDVLVVVGLGFEEFLAATIGEVAQRGVRVVTASAGIATAGDPPDPHVWVDPLRAQRMVENIAAGLAAKDPERADAYRARAARAVADLAALDAEFRAALSDVPKRQFLAFHPAWGYFAARYGLEQVGVIEETAGQEPTAQELAGLIARVRATGVRVLVTEPQFSPRVAESLARDLGLAVAEANPEGGEPAADGYEQFMRANVRAFAAALSE